MRYEEAIKIFEIYDRPFDVCVWREKAWASQKKNECYSIMIDEDGEQKVFDDAFEWSDYRGQLTEEDLAADDWVTS